MENSAYNQGGPPRSSSVLPQHRPSTQLHQVQQPGGDQQFAYTIAPPRPQTNISIPIIIDENGKLKSNAKRDMNKTQGAFSIGMVM